MFTEIIERGYPKPQREYEFATDVGRKHRFDIAWPDVQIPALGGMRCAFEIEGGGEVGRHMKRAGYREDCQKCNLAAVLGWVVFRFTPEMLEAGEHWRVLELIWPVESRGQSLVKTTPKKPSHFR